MIKLALIGDSVIQHYAVADRLWELVSVVANKRFKFDIIPLATPGEVRAAFEAFKKDSSFIGFNIAAPWEDVLADQVDKLEELMNPFHISNPVPKPPIPASIRPNFPDVTTVTPKKLERIVTRNGSILGRDWRYEMGSIDLPTINTVYKDKSGSIIGANTGPLAAQQAMEARGNLYKTKSVLIIGEKGAGLPIAYHFYHNLDKKTYLYDPSMPTTRAQKGVVRLSSLRRVAQHKYDLIINATPLGRYYFDKRVEAFTSPLDLETLDQVSHKNTIVQETNYLPGTTLLLQMARHLGLQTVTGDMMLVFEAIESLRRYFGITLDENTIHLLVEEISTYIDEREAAILEQDNS